jgi:hypothetical protein
MMKGDKQMENYFPLLARSSMCLKIGRVAFVLVCLWLTVGAGNGFAQQQAPKAAPATEIDPKAIDALKAMGAELRKLKAFELRSETTIDEVLDNGQKVQFGGTVDFRVRRPNGLRAEIVSDRRHRVFYFNGKTLTQYGPTNGYYASIAAPPTISELLQVLDEKYGVELPLADLFLWGTDKDGLNDITSAIYIGSSRIGGVDCDHYVFRQADVDWQIWIERGKIPLPRKLVITTTSEPAQPQYVAVLKWDLASKLDDKTFTFVPPKGAQRIELATTTALAAEKK